MGASPKRFLGGLIRVGGNRQQAGGVEEPGPALAGTPTARVRGTGNHPHQIHLADLSERSLCLDDLTGGDALRSDDLGRSRAAVGHGHQGQSVTGTRRLPAAHQAGGDAAGRKTAAGPGQRHSGRLGPQASRSEEDPHTAARGEQCRRTGGVMRRWRRRVGPAGGPLLPRCARARPGAWTRSHCGRGCRGPRYR